MLKKTRKFKIAICCYCAFFLCLPSSGIGEVILCIGQDGHTAVAISSNKKCCSEAASGQEIAGASGPGLSAADNCPPCVDIPVMIERDSGLVHTAGHAQKYQPAPFAEPTLVPEPARRCADSRAALPYKPPLGLLHSYLRTVILLI